MFTETRKKLYNRFPVYRKLKDRYTHYKFPLIYKEELREALVNSGIANGSNLFVHSSVNSIGLFEEGVYGQLHVLQDVIGDQGLLAMPAFPQGDRKKILEKHPVFNYRKDPSRVGLLTEIFRRQKGVSRSIHPTHSITAKGDKAAWLTKDHENCLWTFGEGSPFYKLLSLNSQILLLGVPLDNLTFVHVAEDLLKDEFPVPMYCENPVITKVFLPDGSIKKIKVKVHSSHLSRIMNTDFLEQELFKAKAIKKIKIKNRLLILIDANKLNNMLMSLAKEGKAIWSVP